MSCATTVIESDAEAVRAGARESAACTVNPNVPPDVGVPETAPVEAFSVSPGGRLPVVMLHVYGAFPPVAATLCEYACPTVPPGSELVVMVSGSATVMDSDFVADCEALSVTRAVNA